MRKIIAILLAALTAFALAACSTGSGKAPDVSATLSPSPVPEAPYEILSSGGKKILNSNCLSIDFVRTEDTVTATMTFASGSERNGTAQTVADGVPEYRAYLTGTPQRLVVEFYELNYWDYDRTLDLGSAQDLLHGVFRQFQTNDDRFRIIFQLKEGAEASVSASGGTLTVRFKPKDIDHNAKWYATVDALFAFAEGTAEGIGLFPTLCADGKTTLISRPFETKEEAQTFADSLPYEVLTSLGQGGVGVQALAGNSLPNWSSASVNAQIYETAVVKIDGEPAVLPVVMEDGIYLCSSPNGNTAVFSRLSSEQGANGETESTEELWALDTEGRMTRLTEADFSTILMAEYSPDGRKLAILERAEEICYLYVLNLDTERLTNISDFGLGKITTNFIWDQLGSEIYVMSGNDALELMKYDFTITDESQRVTLVEDKEIEEGSMAFFNGDLYFANPDKEGTGKIYRIKPEGGMRAEVTAGDSFVISPDGRYMAILESFEIGEEGDETQNNTSIKLRSMTTGEEIYLVRDRYIVNIEWGQSGLLYYTEGTDTTGEADYGFALYSYDLNTQSTTQCAEMVSSDFRTTPDPAVLYIPYYYADETTHLRATYRLELRG
ncbi:MAG: hypothetical protein ACOYI3_01535 [Christensenellales bacterium]|jgi:dipeptidyl aminopeptidase/acylaminoacyl peptidase/predicted small secreted protein